MQIRADVELAFARDRVFETYRDRMPDLAQFLPNIRSIKVLSRTERDGEIELVNEWVGGGDIPAVARSIISESMIRWTDYATWKAASYTVEWRTEVHAFPGAVRSSGLNRFIVAPGGVRLEIRGELVCDASKVPAIPRLLARSVNGALEKLLVGRIEPNLVGVAKGVGKLLERDG